MQAVCRPDVTAVQLSPRSVDECLQDMMLYAGLPDCPQGELYSLPNSNAAHVAKFGHQQQNIREA